MGLLISQNLTHLCKYSLYNYNEQTKYLLNITYNIITGGHT